MTAVKWLEMEIVKLETKFAIIGNIYELCEQAKKIEKQQIIDAYTHDRFILKITAEQYYNEKFKK